METFNVGGASWSDLMAWGMLVSPAMLIVLVEETFKRWPLW